MLSRSVVSDCLQPHGLEPARLLCPWGFSRREYWSGLPCPPPGDLPNPGIKPRSSVLQADLYRLSHQGSTTYSCCPSVLSCPSGTLETYLVCCSLDSSPTGSPTSKTLHSDSKTHLATGNPRNQEPGAQTACPSN